MIEITTTRKPLPPRILIYGPPGVGKTTIAASVPGVVIMPVEQGMDAINAPAMPQPVTWGLAMDQIESLIVDQQGFRALAIDSVTTLQDLCFRAVCDESRVKSIEEIGFGKGYVRAGELWRGMLDRLAVLRQKMIIILIGHSAVLRHEDPRLPGYDRMGPRLQVNAKGGGIGPMTVEWCDVVACAAYQVATTDETAGLKTRTRAVGTSGDRMIYVQEQPAVVAKNRYGLASELPFAWQPLIEGIRAAFRTPVPVPVPVPVDVPVADPIPEPVIVTDL